MKDKRNPNAPKIMESRVFFKDDLKSPEPEIVIDKHEAFEVDGESKV